MRVAVLVGGDLACSTRMLQHVRILASSGIEVQLFGSLESPVDVPAGVEIVHVPGLQRLRARGVLLLPVAFLRQLGLAASWFRALRRLRANVLLLQNPPAFPLLLLLRLQARQPLLIDWHNVTGAMLRQRSRVSWIARAVGCLELAVARTAVGHFAVSRALERHLATQGIAAHTVYDLPSRFASGTPFRRADEVRIVVPSTWSVDDAFDVLAEAAQRWSGVALRFVLTGRGGDRERVLGRLRAAAGKNVTFEARWLEPREFASTLASADLGLSLHRSTSGFDLPMKLVEMRAAGLPVCVLDYGDVLRERYRDGAGIRFFSNAETLVTLLEELLEGWPHPKRLDALRPNPDDAVPNAWESEWRARVEPVLRSHLPSRS